LNIKTNSNAFSSKTFVCIQEMFWVYQPAPVCVSTCPGIFENNPFWLVFSNAFISKLLNVFIDYFCSGN